MSESELEGNRSMTNKETAAHIRAYEAEAVHSLFSWDTDGCGDKQHIRFVQHRNNHWKGGGVHEWKKFALDYADLIEHEPDVEIEG